MYNPFNPFGSPYMGYPSPTPIPGQTPAPQQAPTLPQQQVLQANGKESISKIRLAPGSSVLVMDNTAPLVWLCTSDSLGNVTLKAYDIKEHTDAPAVDASSFEARLAAVEKRMEALTHESDDGKHHAEQAVGIVE